MLERLARQAYYCFLDGYLDYNQIVVNQEDQEKTTFTCPFGVFAYRRMLLVCVTHQPLSKGSCLPFFLICWKKALKFLWMISPYLVHLLIFV